MIFFQFQLEPLLLWALLESAPITWARRWENTERNDIPVPLLRRLHLPPPLRLNGVINALDYIFFNKTSYLLAQCYVSRLLLFNFTVMI